MKDKKNILLGISYMLVAVVFFFVGNILSNSKKRMQPLGQFSKNIQFDQGKEMRGNGNIFGQIISKDTNSITVELRSLRQNEKPEHGETSDQIGSKIIFLNDRTIINKSSPVKINDLEIGQNISINGISNSDGSINANSIQIR